MLKIREVHIAGHPVLGDLNLDFRGLDGQAVDTVIFAGENGAGKSTVMGLLYDLVSGGRNVSPFGIVTVEFEDEGASLTLSYELEQLGSNALVYAEGLSGDRNWVRSDEFKSSHPMSAVYSDVDINFHASRVSSVTSLTLDSESESRRSSGNLPTEINQLLIDVQALDDADVAYAAKNNPNRCFNELDVEERMPRFTRAFRMIFEDLVYDRIENREGHKEIVFKKHGKEVPISALSSGEKQVVYRGCFLLKDANATKGAFVFIDEPEISLHPAWQQKVMDYYKAMFTDSLGVQTSQIFCVTHSPFVIHNDHRKNDKVIVLKRGEGGRVVVEDKPEYYRCDSVTAVEDAFSIREFSTEVPTVYLEGQTDERYFARALEIFGYKGPVKFKWVGHLDVKGQERYTGASSLSNACEFLAGQNFPVKCICLFDCDTNRRESQTGNVLSFALPYYDSVSRMKKGIENALVLDNVEIGPFYETKIKEGDYGEQKKIQEFKKMEFCNYICSKDEDELVNIFANLKPVIDKAIAFLEGKNE